MGEFNESLSIKQRRDITLFYILIPSSLSRRKTVKYLTPKNVIWFCSLIYKFNAVYLWQLVNEYLFFDIGTISSARKSRTSHFRNQLDHSVLILSQGF